MVSISIFIILFKTNPLNEHFTYDHAFISGYSLSDTFKECLAPYIQAKILEPPLNAVSNYFCLKIAFYGLTFMTLTANISIAVSIFVLSLIGRKMVDKYFGFLITIFCLINATFLGYGNDLRGYSLINLLVSILLYVYFLSRRECNSNKYFGIYAICLAIVAYTNYHAIVLCLGLFIFDCYLKKMGYISFKSFYSYVIAFVLYLPWLVIVGNALIKKVAGLIVEGAAWHLPLSWSFMNKILYDLSGRNGEILYLFMVFGLIVVLYNILRNRQKNFSQNIFEFTIAWLFVFFHSYYRKCNI